MMDVPNTNISLGMESSALDMLAEVASATLKSDPSLSNNINSKKIKCQTSKIHGNTPLRKSSSSDRLTLDQIKVLSDKMLIDMFSELICDEIRKNYSFKCFLIPDECSQTFKSFGSEARARCKMKAHLQSHINDLVSEYNDTTDNPFTAEPLHIRQKRLTEQNIKSPRKKKKGKSPNAKRKSDSPVEKYFDTDMDDFDFTSRNITFQKPYCSPNNDLNCDFQMCAAMNIHQNVGDASNIQLPGYHEKSMNIEQQYNFNKYYDDQSSNLITSPDSVKVKLHKRKKSKKQSVFSSSTQASYTVKWDIDFDEVALNNSSQLNSDKEKTYPQPYVSFHQDHTYTSVHGNTYDVSSEEYKNTLDKSLKESKNTQLLSKTTKPLVIPTPPFPYIYSPMLPHIAEITEIGNNSYSACIPFHHHHACRSVHGSIYYDVSTEEYKNAFAKSLKEAKNFQLFIKTSEPLVIRTPPFPFIYAPMFPYIAEIAEIENNSYSACSSNVHLESCHESAVAMPIKKSHEKDLNYDFNDFSPSEDDEAISEDDENTQSDSLDDVVSDNETYSETDSSTMLNSTFIVDDDVLETDCPANLQSVEKKLALKCIRALRTKKKDERGPLVCRICKNKSFTAQATLMYHYRSHAGIKPFSCTVCDATFTRQHSLNYHMLIHDNKSRFECNDCGRNFRHPSHYKEHLRRHTGETPYQCTDCNLRFKTRNTYKRHLKTRHGKILSAQGIHVLPVEEFYKVRTSPRPKTCKPESQEKEHETRWSKILFSEENFYF